MPEKKSWKEWVVNHITHTGKCPGDVPTFGLPTDMMTREEFDLAIAAAPKHKYNDCHFLEDVLGLGPSLQGMKEVKVKEGDYEDKIDNLQGEVTEVENQKRVAKLKENLHLYVNRIHFKKNGTLSVPAPLLGVSAYIGKFFSG